MAVSGSKRECQFHIKHFDRLHLPPLWFTHCGGGKLVYAATNFKLA